MNHDDVIRDYEINTKFISSLMDYQHHNKDKDNDKDTDTDTDKGEDTFDDELNILTKKYQRYNEKIYDHINDPYVELIDSKDVIIKELRSKIEELKQELIDVSILYNDKIELIRNDQRKELHTQHKEYLKQLKKNNIQ